jgi:hypothetical protein
MVPGATIFLYLLPLAAAPVVFHLLMRRRRRRVLFSTKMFFHRVSPRLTFHRKLREMLLLAARVVLIALLLLALSRLTVTGMGDVLGLGGNQAAVVVIDNSASMAGRVKGGERAKLKTALEGARTLLANMEEGAKAGIVLLVPDPRAGRWGGMTSERQLLLDYLDKLQVTEATGGPARSIMRAMALLKGAAPAGGGSVHVFTDLQETEWKEPRMSAEDVRQNVRVFFHRVPTAPAELPNVCMMSAKTSSRRILPRQPYQVELLLRNDGDREQQIRVNRKDSEHAIADGEAVSIPAGARKTVRLGFRSQSPGYHWIRIWIEGDGFAGDNRISISYICEPKGNIYFVGEQRAGDFGLLPLAFSPHGDGRYTSLVPSFCTLESLPGRMEKKRPMLVVLKWSDACALEGKTDDLLEEYTRQGGNLLVLPAVAGKKPSGDPPAWLGAAPGNMKVLQEAAPLVVPDGMSEFWSDLRGPDGQVGFGGVYAKRYYPLSLRAGAGYVPLLGPGDDRILLAIRRLGKGQITVSGMAFAGRREGVREWSTLPRKKAFLVMAQPIALGAVSSLVNRSMSLVAGNAPRSLPGKGDEVKITTLVGDQVDWSGPRDQVPVLVREGAYVVRMGERETCLSVIPSDAEGNSAFIDGSEVTAMGGVPHVVRELSDEEDFRDELESSIAGMGLYLPLLLLATATLMAEGLLGSPSLRRKKRPAGGEEHEGREEPGTAPAARSGEGKMS